MTAWATPTIRQQIHADALRKLGRRATRRCPRCGGDRRVPRLLFGGTKRCPRCQGDGEVETAAVAALERKMMRSWDRKQRVANARAKRRLGT